MNKIYTNRPLVLPEDSKKRLKNRTDGVKFKELLRNKLKSKELKFSKHAQQRIQSRGIEFTEQDLNQLQKGIKKARNKGAKESLVLVNNNAYVVSIKNDTVITAMDEGSMKDNLFTNIDSAIVMK